MEEMPSQFEGNSLETTTAAETPQTTPAETQSIEAPVPPSLTPEEAEQTLNNIAAVIGEENLTDETRNQVLAEAGATPAASENTDAANTEEKHRFQTAATENLEELGLFSGRLRRIASELNPRDQSLRPLLPIIEETLPKLTTMIGEMRELAIDHKEGALEQLEQHRQNLQRLIDETFESVRRLHRRALDTFGDRIDRDHPISQTASNLKRMSEKIGEFPKLP